LEFAALFWCGFGEGRVDLHKRMELFLTFRLCVVQCKEEGRGSCADLVL